MASRYLSEELVIEILSRLPVNPLMRFKCVCKTWCSLTTNPSLIAAHLNNKTDRTVSWNGNTKGLIVGSDDFHVFPNCIRNLQPVNLKFGFKRKPDSVLGSIHGIFCVYWKPNVIKSRIRSLPIIALWNPATSAFRVLPMSNFDFPPYKPVGLNDCILGFGFDMKTGNFKVVKAVCFWDEGWVNCVEVYNLNSDSWRVLSDVVKFKGIQISPNMIVSKYTNNNNNGVFHWCLYRSTENGIIDEVVVSFDTGEEVFKVTVLTKDYGRVMAPTLGKFLCNLTLVKGSLAMICSFLEERHSRSEVWVMKNYEVDESWSLELSVGPDRGLHASLGFWNDNELPILRASLMH